MPTEPLPDKADEPQVEDAMAVYSTDGQLDDETGSDAAAEQLRDEVDPNTDKGIPHGPH